MCEPSELVLGIRPGSISRWDLEGLLPDQYTLGISPSLSRPGYVPFCRYLAHAHAHGQLVACKETSGRCRARREELLGLLALSSFCTPHVSFYSLFSCASFCHASLHLFLSTSMLCAVLLPFSFSSRFMRVAAAARPIDKAKMGSRLLSSYVSNRSSVS